MQTNVKRAGLAQARRALLALARRVPTVQAAAATGIHQSQVSRLYRGRFVRVSGNVRRLLEYAEKGAAASAPARRRTLGEQAVIRAALGAWDATPEGARALVRLLKSVREVAGRASPRRAGR